MTIPLYGFVEGDTLGVLVIGHADMTIAEVIARLSDAVSARVDPAGPWQLFARDAPIPLDQLNKTLADVGLDAFERIDLRRLRGTATTPAGGGA
jgi:hypothetical protein